MIQFNQLISAVTTTIRDPRLATRYVMQLELPLKLRWETLILVAVLSAIFAYISQYASFIAAGDLGPSMNILSPVSLGFSQLVVMIAMVYSMYFVGKWFGGTGNLADAILLVSWLQFVLICLQIIQILAILVSPAISLVIGMIGLVLVFVLLTLFISEMHGFKSVAGVFFSVLFVMLIIATFIRFVFNLFGFDIIGVL